MKNALNCTGRRLAIVLAAMALAGASVWLATGARGEATPAPGAVEIKGFKFAPAELEVSVGATVTWTNNDAIDHTVNSGTPAAPEKGPLGAIVKGKGGTYTHTFDKAGVYPYYCDYHHKMKGKIVVK